MLDLERVDLKKQQHLNGVGNVRWNLNEGGGVWIGWLGETPLESDSRCNEKKKSDSKEHCPLYSQCLACSRGLANTEEKKHLKGRNFIR